MQRSALCRSRRELSNAYLLANFGIDTAENEPCQVLPDRGVAERDTHPLVEGNRAYRGSLLSLYRPVGEAGVPSDARSSDARGLDFARIP